MTSRTRVLGPGNGPPSARVLFVAEAPGRHGGERTGVPLCGDQSGVIFDRLLAGAGLERRKVFITNAVLCNPQTEDGRNDRPRRDEIERCSPFLAETIDVLDPAVVLSLGIIALSALAFVAPHGLRLSEHVATPHAWNGRLLVPLYHPSPRVVARRGFGALAREMSLAARVIGAR
jgi:DNA polymerase